ncbi:cobalt-precorrin-5B (C(1))-methyltransferase CbiD [Myxacorys almedinensis]|uniref:Cobalt-precorrin-5B C(1)-methyltransferase n=1 Tax=Myxacorys almedinensis A TaxID=2690445 RepID=A0A8J8CL01_9CYAN|nr:cobalt-precorrin-5B (C(1))-methyltransferase CbiD [Myxacorys almedinensis]NDJ19116.1 cobalt-precorrin-5B (C(1))-methyltransferase [Myxacorys almedinensis A]
MEVRAGYTLPVFACASAIAALNHLRSARSIRSVEVDLIAPAKTVTIAIEQVANLQPGVALAITRSDPGDNLDLTRDTPVWAMVRLGTGAISGKTRLAIAGGEGIGHMEGDAPAIYAYAKQLLSENLERLLKADETLHVTLLLPEGRSLAKRTSNEAFGVVEGLSLLGTSGIAQPLSAPGQLELFRQELQQKAQRFDCLVFCVGENGLDLATKMGIEPERLVKTANWLGSLLVEAGMQQVKSILLFGYHGKLIKLAGGIFHTHHHVADARLEILTAHCANAGLPTADLRAIFECATTEEGLKYLKTLEGDWVTQVYGAIAATIDRRCRDYIYTHSGSSSEASVVVGSVLFDRSRQILIQSQIATTLLKQVC